MTDSCSSPDPSASGASSTGWWPEPQPAGPENVGRWLRPELHQAEEAGNSVAVAAWSVAAVEELPAMPGGHCWSEKLPVVLVVPGFVNPLKWATGSDLLLLLLLPEWNLRVDLLVGKPADFEAMHSGC